MFADAMEFPFQFFDARSQVRFVNYRCVPNIPRFTATGSLLGFVFDDRGISGEMLWNHHNYRDLVDGDQVVV